MASPFRLIRSLDWFGLLESLEFHPVRRTLPHPGLRCPGCGSGVAGQVFNSGAGPWFSCQRCPLSVDLLTLAARVDAGSLEGAIAQAATAGWLHVHGGDHVREVAAAVATANAQQQACQTFWQQCRGPSADSNSNMQDLQRQLRWTRGWQPSGLWARRGGRCFGSCALDATVPDLHIFPSKPKRRGWSGALVVPAWDAPGRFQGFLLLGGPRWPLDAHFAYHTRDGQAGLLLLDLLPEGHATFGTTRFVVTDPRLAVRLQLQHLQESEDPLPLLGAFRLGSRESLDAWHHLPERPTLVWDPDWSAEMFRQAVRLQGRVSSWQPTDALLQQTLQHQTPRGFLRMLQRQTLAWPDALLQRLEQGAAQERQAFLSQLDWALEKLEPLLQGVSPATRGRLLGLWPRPTRTSTAARGRQEVARASPDGGLVLKPSGRLLCNTYVDIQRVVCRGRRREYQGWLMQPGWREEFRVDARRLQGRVFTQWLRDELLRRKRVLELDPAWTRSLFDVYVQLSAPQVVTGLTQTGWNRELQCFDLPRFRIPTAASTGVLEPPIPLGRMPGARLQNTRELPLASRELLRAQPPSATAWAAFGALVAGVVLPALRATPPSLLAAGSRAAEILEAVVSGGDCRRVQRMPTARRARRVTWPVWLAGVSPRHPCLELQSQPPANFWLTGDWLPLAVLAAASPWSVLHCSRTEEVPASPRVFGELLIAYLYDLGRRNLELPGEGRLPLRLLQDLSRWLDRCGLPACDLQGGLWEGPGAQAKSVGRLLATCLHHGWFRLVDARWNSGGRDQFVLRAEQVDVPVGDVGQRLARAGCPWLTIASATEALKSAGVLLAVSDSPAISASWVLPAAWLQERCAEVGSFL